MQKKVVYSLAISLILTIIIFFFSFSSFTGHYVVGEYARVKRVIDGDTIITYSGEKIRLLGIDAPEQGMPFYKEAKDYLKKLVENKTIKLVSCGTNKDRYGRLLRFVFVKGKLINLELVKKGLAYTFFIGNCNRYSSRLMDAEEYARKHQLGVWKRSKFWGCINITKFNYLGKNEFVTFLNKCNYPINMTGWYIKDEDEHFFFFPNFMLLPKHTVTVYTNNKTSKFSFNSSIPIWNNSGDSLFLRDSSGLLVAFYTW